MPGFRWSPLGLPVLVWGLAPPWGRGDTPSWGSFWQGSRMGGLTRGWLLHRQEPDLSSRKAALHVACLCIQRGTGDGHPVGATCGGDAEDHPSGQELSPGPPRPGAGRQDRGGSPQVGKEVEGLSGGVRTGEAGPGGHPVSREVARGRPGRGTSGCPLGSKRHTNPYTVASTSLRQSPPELGVGG